MHLARFPRVNLAHLPTPLEPMERLSKHLGGTRLWIKRDDCTGLSSGGNKTRKLEFLMGEALYKGADDRHRARRNRTTHGRRRRLPRSLASYVISCSKTALATTAGNTR